MWWTGPCHGSKTWKQQLFVSRCEKIEAHMNLMAGHWCPKYIRVSLMIGFVIVSDRKQKPISNIKASTWRRDNLNVVLIVFNWPLFMSTHALGFNRCIMGHQYPARRFISRMVLYPTLNNFICFLKLHLCMIVLYSLVTYPPPSSPFSPQNDSRNQLVWTREPMISTHVTVLGRHSRQKTIPQKNAE